MREQHSLACYQRQRGAAYSGFDFGEDVGQWVVLRPQFVMWSQQGDEVLSMSVMRSPSKLLLSILHEVLRKVALELARIKECLPHGTLKFASRENIFGGDASGLPSECAVNIGSEIVFW